MEVKGFPSFLRVSGGRCGDWRRSRNSLSVSGGEVVLPDSHKSLFTYFLSTFFLRATAT